MRVRPNRSWLVALPWVAAALALIPLLRGFPRGHDWSIELVRVAEYGSAIGGGQLPPAWAENLYGGYGSPIFLFFPPLHSAVSWALGALAGSVPTGAVLAIATFAVVGTAAMVRLGRLVAGGDGVEAREAGRVAACLFVLHPYLIGDALLRNANAEYAALCLAPVAVAGLLDLPRNRMRGALWLSGGLGLVTLAHNQMALLVAATIVVMGAVLYASRRALWPVLAGAFALGLALAMFFWLPALTLLSRVPATDVLTESFDFRTSFPAVSEIFAYGPFFGAGLLPLIVLGIGVWLAVRGVEQQRLLVVLLIGAAAAFVLMLSLSTPVWEVVPGLDLFQFPWRFQGPLALFTAAVGAIAYAAWARGRPLAHRRAVQLAVLLFAFVNAVPHLLDVRSLTTETRAGLDNALTAESVRRNASTATVGDEYLPRGAVPGTWTSQPLGGGGVVAVEGAARIDVLEETGTLLRLNVAATGDVTVRLGRWVFPGWSLTVDDVPRELEPNSFGSVDVPLTAGTRQVELSFRAPLVRRAGLVVSALALLVWIGLLVRSRRARSRRSSEELEPQL